MMEGLIQEFIAKTLSKLPQNATLAEAFKLGFGGQSA